MAWTPLLYGGLVVPLHVAGPIGLKLGIGGFYFPRLPYSFKVGLSLGVNYRLPILQRPPAEHKEQPQPPPSGNVVAQRPEPTKTQPAPKPVQPAAAVPPAPSESSESATGGPKPNPSEPPKPEQQPIANVEPQPESTPAPTTPVPARQEGAAPRFPPQLETQLSFEEMGRKDQALDAGEHANIVVVVRNLSTKGTARNVMVRAEAISSMSGIDVGSGTVIPEIAPGATDTVRVPLSASEDVEDQELRFRVSALEGSLGADAAPGMIAITARAIEPPDLYVYDNGICDDSSESEWAQGNGDGQLEVGEQVEVTSGIQNKGAGQAQGVSVTVVPLDSNVKFQSGRNTTSLGDMASNDARTFKYAIYVSPRFQGQQVELELAIHEQREQYSRTDTVSIPLNQQVAKGSDVVVSPRLKSGSAPSATPPPISDELLNGVPTNPENPDVYAVVIGVGKYRQVTGVDFAEQDARAVQRYFRDAFGCPEANLTPLVDPTKGDLERIFGTEESPEGALSNWVSRQPNTAEVYVYYVGHGMPSARNKRAYLAPADASPDYIEQNGYPLDLLYANLLKLPVRKVTVIIDACFSGETPDMAGKVGSLLKNASAGFVPVSLPAQAPNNAVIMTASTADQVAVWYPEMNHSLFTYWLLKGLKGEADRNGDKIITLGELKQYLDDNVPPIARQLYNREQTPEVQGNMDSELLRLH